MRNKANKPKIKYTHGNESVLDQIKPLWEGLNEYNLLLSPYFKQHYQAFTFEARKAYLLNKVAAKTQIRIDIAIDKTTTQPAGYIVSSITKEKTGEIDSIFVAPFYRGFGIGDALMKKALAWMEKKNVAEKTLEISIGNEQTLSFYSRYGFYPRKILLKQIKEC
jgi:ribosomal protein S18 acetylase RimI-like enzyme